jgi:hypothetical protein
MLHLPEAGLVGNSHLLMMEENNLEVADLLIDWSEENWEMARKSDLRWRGSAASFRLAQSMDWMSSAHIF